MNKSLFISALILCSQIVTGQDHMHFAQYRWINSWFNPALNEHHFGKENALSLIYRDQAFNVTNSSYKTIAAGFDTKMGGQMSNWALSSHFLNDQVGKGGLRTTSLGLSPSFKYAFKGNQWLSFGTQMAYFQRSLGDQANLVFEEELMGGSLTENLNLRTRGYFDYGFGAGYGISNSRGVSLLTGISLLHLNNTLSLSGVDNLPRRVNAFIELRKRIKYNLEFVPSVQTQHSSAFSAIQIQSQWYWYPEATEYVIIPGLGWRIDDAIEFMLGIGFRAWEAFFVYEVNTSGLRDASGAVAALEVGIKYRYQNVDKDTTQIILLTGFELPLEALEPLPRKGIESLSRVVRAHPQFATLPSDKYVERSDKNSSRDDFAYEEDTNIRLENIYFAFDDHHILKESSAELEKLLRFLNDHQDVVIELAAHTDSRGTEMYNHSLSQRRADEVKEWLTTQGIDGDRVIARGYGESRLINHCDDNSLCPEALHRENRRVEFSIVNEKSLKPSFPGK